VLFNQEPPPRETEGGHHFARQADGQAEHRRTAPAAGRPHQDQDARPRSGPARLHAADPVRRKRCDAPPRPFGGRFYDLRTSGLRRPDAGAHRVFTTLPHGILLVTGPTGSGKSTTLYSALKRINKPDKKIITIEDPVEYQMDGINQIHVNPQIGLTFAAGLRHIVRQDPDVIMVGEIRDRETADIAIRAALTGHFVLLHAAHQRRARAPSRACRHGRRELPDDLVAGGVLAQRLVRTICPACRIPAGNSPCAGTGYSGRVGIFELMELNEDLRRLIMANADAAQITAAARRHGMRTLREDGWEKVRSGLTTADEVMRVTQEF
jgi:general secretion pathway protein E